MADKSKKCNFSEIEKERLKDLVFKFKDKVECKKSDTVSLAQKKLCWEKIKTEFNSNPSHAQRTASQLKKCWENLKFRRKAEIGEEKRERLRTGGGPCTSKTLPEDPILDSVGLDIELRDAIDSDTVQESPFYKVSGDLLVPVQDIVQSDIEEVVQEEGGFPEQEQEVLEDSVIAGPTQSGVKRKKITREDEVKSRISRNKLFIEQDKELYKLKFQEQELKVKFIQEQIENEKTLFILQKTKLELEIEKLKGSM